MNGYADLRDPPLKRRAGCDGEKERHLSEAAVMIAFAMHLFKSGATTVELHPDGEHGKRHDVKRTLESQGFTFMSGLGTTKYGGVYRRGQQTLVVKPQPGLGDVVASIGGRAVVAECKGGIVNTRHRGQVSRLRRGLSEAVGLLMTRSVGDERQVAVVPATSTTERIANRMLPRALAAGIEIALVDESGSVRFLSCP